MQVWEQLRLSSVCLCKPFFPSFQPEFPFKDVLRYQTKCDYLGKRKPASVPSMPWDGNLQL